MKLQKDFNPKKKHRFLKAKTKSNHYFFLKKEMNMFLKLMNRLMELRLNFNPKNMDVELINFYPVITENSKIRRNDGKIDL